MTTDLHTLSGAFALDALSSEEAEEFTRHLAECEACRDEVREFQAVVARMAATAPAAPPPALRARVLAAADRQAQLPPLVTSIEAARSRRWRNAVVGVAAAAALIVGTAVGINLLQDERQPSGSTSVALSPVERVLKAPDARTATIRTTNGGRVQVATSVEVGQVALATRQLPSLTDRVYQAWTLSDKGIVSQGVIRNVREGKVFGLPSAGTRVAISVEPVGGSKQPTTEPIVNVDPRAV